MPIFGRVLDYLKISVWATYRKRANYFVYCHSVTSRLAFYYYFHTKHREGASFILYGQRTAEPVVQRYNPGAALIFKFFIHF